MPTEISGSTGVNKITDGTVVTADIAADAIDGTKIADNAINSEHITAGGVDDAHLATGITASKLTGTLPAISGASLTGLTSAQMPAGSVLQVLEVLFGDQTTFTTGSYVDSGISLAITPSSTSSKILVFANVHGYLNGAGQIGMNLVRTTTQIAEASIALGYDDNESAMMTLTKLDSPSTTSATTYKVQIKETGGSSTTRINQQDGNSTLILMEIAG